VKRVLLGLLLTSLSPSSAGRPVSAGLTLTVSATDLTVRRGTEEAITSLRTTLMLRRNPACAARLRLSPLSFVDGVLAVQVVGSFCLGPPAGEVDTLDTIDVARPDRARRTLANAFPSISLPVRVCWRRCTARSV
jgi:hypothetical protein